MSPEHTSRRSQVVLVEPALSQLEKLTASETHRLDRAIVAISVNPELGTPVPDTLLRDGNASSGPIWAMIRPTADFEIPNSRASWRIVKFERQ